ncbi:MAG: cell division protein SepF [Candidatus Asgardarchaeia archaeon]
MKRIFGFIKRDKEGDKHKKQSIPNVNLPSTDRNMSHTKSNSEDMKKFLETLGFSAPKTQGPDSIKSVDDEQNYIFVKSTPLMGFSDIDPLEDELSKGNIVVVDLEPLLDRISGRRELDRVIARLRGLITKVGGDMAQIGDSQYIILTPKTIRVWVDEEI